MNEQKNKQQEKLDKRAAKLRDNLKRRKAVTQTKKDLNKEKTQDK